MELGDLKKIVRIFETSDLTRMEYGVGDTKIVLEKGGKVTNTQIVREIPFVGSQAVENSLDHLASTSTLQVSPTSPKDELKQKPAKNLTVITSPMVGIFYSASSPTTQPFVEKGKHVSKGDTLCIIEAMKLMNEIESDISGVIVNIYPENGHPVEFGQPLFEIDPQE